MDRDIRPNETLAEDYIFLDYMCEDLLIIKHSDVPCLASEKFKWHGLYDKGDYMPYGLIDPYNWTIIGYYHLSDYAYSTVMWKMKTRRASGVDDG